MNALISKSTCDINICDDRDESSPLHTACKNGHLNIVKVLSCDQNCYLNTKNIIGNTPLHVACYQKSLDIIRLLIERKCSTNIRNKKNETAQDIPLNKDGDCLLHIACQWGDVDIVRYLITDEKCNLNVKSLTSENTPLHIASKRKSLDIIKILLERRCNTNIPNKKGETAQNIPLNKDGDCLLHIACQWGDVDIVRYLITDQRCDLNVQNVHLNTPLHTACYTKSLLIIQCLIEMRCSTNIPNKKGQTAQDIPLNKDGDCLLHIACQWGDVGIVKYLINDEKCNPHFQSSTSENTPLHIAAKYGQDDTIVQLLSYKESDPNAQNKEGHTPLHVAVRQRKSAAISQLLAHQQCNPNVQNKEGDTPLHIACCAKSLHITKLLLGVKCSTNIPNKKGETAQDIPLNEDGDFLLHIACQWGDLDIVKYLITDQRCDLNVQNVHLNTPLHTACYVQLLLIIQCLIKRRCSTNIPNTKGETAQNIPLNEDGDRLLHIACQWGDVDIVRYLITDQRCDLNVQNVHLNAPLHTACYVKSLLIIQCLIEMRCSTNIPNKKGQTAQDIPLNKDGHCLLHIACQWGDVGIVKYLINDEKCNPHFQSSTSENTPLHIAAKYGQDDTIVQLLSYKECDPNAQNKEGHTPLHVAVRQRKSAAISQLLTHQQCNPNVQNKEGDTPLHIACCAKSLHITKLLLGVKCSTNIPNKKGETAQDIPLNEDGDCLLHIACQWGNVDIVRYLINDEKCNPHFQSSTSKNTPLHIAAKYGQDDTIVQLLSYKGCNPNAQNKEGDTAVHVAVKQSLTTAVSPLLACQQCDPNVQNKVGDTALHSAVWFGHDNTIIKLLSCKKCNPNIQNNEGDTPLHITVKTDKLKRFMLMITDTHCDVNVLNNDHFTPLLIAIKHNNPTIATTLLQQHKCDATLRDSHGNTPLHLACIGGESHPEMVKVAKQLLTLTDVDPSCVNDAGQTPIELTTNYQLIQAISHMVKCKTNQSVQTYINMFIVGNPETGKSTLVKAICKEATSILWRIIPKKMRRVKNVPLHTAGIIPTTFRSKTFGNTVFYDLAGQVEYYTSHAAVIQSTVISTPPAFIVVVNLSESEEKICQRLRYWWSFIDNHAAQSSAPPQVILAGSHADVVRSTGKSVKLKMTQITDILKKLPASFHFAGHVALDCRDPASRELQHFCSLVNKSCSALRETADVDLHCHVLYAFLLERFKDKVACTVSDVATSIKESSALLPQKLDSLLPLISTLSGKGLLLLVKGGESHGDWWIILQKQALLGEINGAIFAPKDFSEHKDLSWSTGIVPFSKLKTEFSDYNPNMVTEFLIHLEFCFIIKDPKTLSLLKDKAEDTSSDVSEDYYFFPALISVKNPFDVWEQNDDMCCKCGWLYKCIQPDQFLTTQFLHVLILHLAFTFALKLDPGDCHQDSLALRRKCSVWKHGIGWRNLVQIETVVEVGLQCQSVIVMMRCPKGKEAECVQLRSEVIQRVLETKDEHCKAVKMSESFVHPNDIMYPLTGKFKDYSLTGIARVIIEGTTDVLDRTLKNPILLKDLLLFDTYTSTGLLRELFSKKHSMDEEVRSQVLEALNSEFIENCTILHIPSCMFFSACL